MQTSKSVLASLSVVLCIVGVHHVWRGTVMSMPRFAGGDDFCPLGGHAECVVLRDADVTVERERERDDAFVQEVK